MPVATIIFMLEPRVRRRDTVALPFSSIEGSTSEPWSKRSMIPEPGNAAVLSGKRAGNWAGDRPVAGGAYLCALGSPPRVDVGEIDLNLIAR